MQKIKHRIFQTIGVIGALSCVALFIYRPSFLTPDKLFIFLFFIFLVLQQAVQMTKRLGPFVVLILVYESFRSVVPRLNNHIHYSLAPRVDRLLFHSLPTKKLQDWLWRGHTSWYDIALYIPYMLFFVIPIGLALLVWKTRDQFYWRVVTTYLVVFFSAFLTFLLYPTAPPWLASQNHYIEPIVRVSSNVWFSLGIHNFPSFYNHIAPNPVASVPSLHAACATLLSIFIFKLYGRRWGAVSTIYPISIYVGVVYEGEHYAFDVVCGIVYAILGYVLTPYLMDWFKQKIQPLFVKYGRSLKTAGR
jgi:membrane-associated phospholipid phosphatase